MKPLISVIVPIYQAEKFLPRAIESVINQTYRNIELILVDDGSTDNSGKICDEYAINNDCIKVIHQTNQGVCAARNAGMNLTEGEYLILLDSDDALDPCAVEVLYEKIGFCEADIAIGPKRIINNDGTERTYDFSELPCIWNGLDFLLFFLEDHPAVYSACGKLYRTHFVKDVRFSIGRQINEDSFFVFQCAMKQPKVAIQDRCVMNVYATQNSASRGSFSDKYFDILYFAEQKKQLIEKQYPELADKIPNMMVKAHMPMLRMLSSQREKKYRQAERDSIKMICANKKQFKPAIQEDKTWFWIITHHLYGVYKKVKFIKNNIKR